MRRGIACAVVLSGAVFGQAAPPDPALEFEAATVRPAALRGPNERVVGRTGGPGSTDPEQVRYRSADLRNLLLQAYGVPFDQLVAPDWARTERFDILAKLPPGTTQEQFAVMLRNLLIDRFKITSHTEQRDFPVYDLVVAKGGVRMKVSKAVPQQPAAPREPTPADPAQAAADAEQMLAQMRAGGGMVRDKDGFPALPEDNFAFQRTLGNDTGLRTSARGQTAAQIAEILQRGFGGEARVMDKTGLTERYDFKLGYSREMNVDAPRAAQNGNGDDLLPDVFAAVQSQLGLRLEKGTARLEILVIDHIEKTPAEN